MQFAEQSQNQRKWENNKTKKLGEIRKENIKEIEETKNKQNSQVNQSNKEI
jgi:hypothetical protein